MTFDSSSFAANDPTEKARVRPSMVCRLVDRLLPGLRAGRLQLVLLNGDVIDRGGGHAGPEATMSVRRWRGLWRMLLDGEHGFAAGYLDGDWSTPALSKLLEFCMHNESVLAEQTEGRWLTRARNRLLHRGRENTRRGSRQHCGTLLPWQ